MASPPALGLTAALLWATGRHSDGGECKTLLFSFLATIQTLGQVPAWAFRVWMTAEGEETSEESGILGSNPSSAIYFLNGPGEL